MEKFDELFETGLKFHGHKCPAMPMGLRAGLAAMKALGVERSQDKELRVLSETGEGHAAGCFLRITSYNVCYTKLLRPRNVESCTVPLSVFLPVKGNGAAEARGNFSLHKSAYADIYSTMKQAAKIFKALSDETRLRILALLSQRELCVCDLMAVLDLPQSTVSRHLAYLRNAGWVEDRRQGSYNFV